MALLALLSDSHGNGEITQAALQVLYTHPLDAIIYLGDLCGEAVLEAFVQDSTKQKIIPVHVVFGNCDYDIASFQAYAKTLGINSHHPEGRLEFSGKTISIQHGHIYQDMERAVADQVDYLCHGHIHLQKDEMAGQTRIICPGALTRATPLSVALLNTDTDQLRFLTI